MSVVPRISEPGSCLYFTPISSTLANRTTTAKPSSLRWQIGSLPQESIGDDELVVSVAGMGSGTIDHSPQKPAAVQRRDRSQLVMAGTTDVAEAGWVLHIAGGTQREISPAGRRALLCRTSKNWSS